MEFVNSSGASGFALIAQIILMPFCFVVTWAILLAMCLILRSCFKCIPKESREMTPDKVWLLLVPCFNIVWIFVVCIRLSRSFRNCLVARSTIPPGQCGYAITIAFCVFTSVLTVLVCALPTSGFLSTVSDILAVADIGGRHYLSHDTGLMVVTLALTIVNIVNPVPIAKVAFLLWKPSIVGLLLPTVALLLLIMMLGRFWMLKRRMGKPG